MRKTLKRVFSFALALCLCLTMLPALTMQANAAGYYSESALGNVKSTILSNSARANYATARMKQHIQSSTDNYRVARNLEDGKSIIFFFDGCSDNVDDATYGNYDKYHLSAYCAIVQKINGVLKVVYESENCSTIPDNPRKVSLNDGTAVPTVLDGVYNIVSTNHMGRYASVRIADNSGSAPVIRCTSTSSYISTSNAINIHARSNFSSAPTNGISSSSYSSTGCFNVGLTNNTWSEYNNFIYSIFGITNAIKTTPYSSGSWTKCTTGVDKGLVIVDRSQYKTQLAAIYGGDNSNNASNLVSKITNYTDNLPPVPNPPDPTPPAPCGCSASYAGEYTCTTSTLPLTIRSGHGTGYSVLGSIPSGATVKVTKASGTGASDWAHVEYNGLSGYASMEYLKPVDKLELRFQHWLSYDKMGESISSAKQGDWVYLCYRIYDKNTGKNLNELKTYNYAVKETIYNPDGSVAHTYTYSNSDNNWIGAGCYAAGTYSYKLELTGDWVGTYTDTFTVSENPKQIHASTNSVTLTLGGTETTTIYVSTSGYHSSPAVLNKSSSNSKISTVWGEWNDEGLLPLTITAKEAGSTTITLAVKDKETGAVLNTTTVNVTVVPKEYTVKYNANEGTGAPSNQTKYHGTTLILSSTKPTRTGYTFLGWSANQNATTATYQPGSKYTANANTTLYAVWRENTYTVRYDLNGGNGGPADQTKYHTIKLTLSGVEPTRTGYIFKGWSTQKNATNPEYLPGDKFAVNANTTLYAVWAATKYSVYFNANGGTGAPGNQTKYHGTTLLLSGTKPTRTGYTFLGWSANQNATTATYQPGSKYTANAGATLYAVWKHSAHTYAGNVCTVCSYEFPLKVTDYNRSATVTVTGGANIWSEPYTSETGKIVRTAKFDSKVTVVGKATNASGNLWYKLSDGNWIYSTNVRITDYDPADMKAINKTFVVTSWGANIWSKPYSSGDSKVARTVGKATTLKIVAQVRNSTGGLWYKVSGGGWVYSHNVTEQLYDSAKVVAFKRSATVMIPGGVNIWSQPATSAPSKVARVAAYTTKLNVVAKYTTPAGGLWYQLSDGNWVYASNIRITDYNASDLESYKKTVVVTSWGANAWSKPYSSGDSKVVKTVAKGAKLSVVAKVRNSTYGLWYKLTDGSWIYSNNVAVK